MKGLTSDQLRFLKEQKIELKYVFNADGLSKSDYREIMQELNMIIAYNVTPCQKEGHTLRTRSGHCCQCKTARIGFQKRYDSEGIVYIAGSLIGNVVKIGFTKAVAIRSESLNRTKYAGLDDWKILFAINSKLAGKIETRANSLLRNYSFALDYNHDGNWHESYETYHAAYSKAKSFVEEAYKLEKANVEIELNSLTKAYEFRNLRKI